MNSEFRVQSSELTLFCRDAFHDNIELLENSEKNEYFVSNELLTINNRVYVSEKLRNEFIKKHHNELTDEY